MIGTEEQPLAVPRAVALDEENVELYIADEKANSISVHDLSGTRKAKFPAQAPTGVVLGEDRVYVVSDQSDEIQVFERTGDKLPAIKPQGIPYEGVKRFRRIARDTRGRLYLTDVRNQVVVVLDKAGKYQYHIGAVDKAARGLHFERIDFVGVQKGKLLITDSRAAKIYRFNLRGKLRFKFGERGGSSGMLSWPGAVVVDREGRYYVLDRVRHTLLFYDDEGKVLGEFGGMGRRPGWFYFPEFMAIDSQDRLYVCDPASARVQILSCQIPDKAPEAPKEKDDEGEEVEPEEEVGPPALQHLRTISSYARAKPFRNPLSVAVDSDRKEILIADAGNHLLAVLSEKGLPVRQIGKSFGRIDPIGVVVDSDEQLYFTDMNNGMVRVLDATGREIASLDLAEVMGETEARPGRMTRDEQGNLYVIERKSCQVVVFNKAYEYVRRFGRKGKGPTEMELAQDVVVSAAREVYVTSSLGFAVHVFDEFGQHLRAFGKHGQEGSKIAFPQGIALDSKSRVWIADSFDHGLKVFTQDGDFLCRHGMGGKKEGDFFFPVDIEIDSKDRLFVTEKGNNRVQVFQIKELDEQADAP